MQSLKPLQWQGWSLASQFAAAGGLVMLLASLIVGSWVGARIEESVVRNTANATAQYMDSFISPLGQDLADQKTLSPGAKQALEEIFDNTPLGERVQAFKIWKEGGVVIEASDPSIIGKTFEETDSLRGAWAGEVQSEFLPTGEAEHEGEDSNGGPLLEIYSPINEVWSGRVIGVVEFYEVADALKRDLRDARRRSWLAVTLVMLAIGASLYAIVLRGSRMISHQQTALDQQVTELRELSDRNTALRMRVQAASVRAAAMNDQSARKLGADLHDGPAQLLAFAALRLDSLRARTSDPATEAELGSVEVAVRDAMTEIRSLSRGLSLPQIESRALSEIVQDLADAHAARTGLPVEVDCTIDDHPEPPAGVKVCIYRFVQEGLSNAWRYGGGKGQHIALNWTNGRLALSVRDEGPGFPQAPALAKSDTKQGGMGLAGLRDRVESLGGVFESRNRMSGDHILGAEIIMTLETRSI